MAEAVTGWHLPDGRILHDRDGMTTERAELMVAAVQAAMAEAEAAFVRGDADGVSEAKRRIDFINEDARRLNRIRQQKIVGWGGTHPDELERRRAEGRILNG
jgi:hypothetical protein